MKKSRAITILSMADDIVLLSDHWWIEARAANSILMEKMFEIILERWQRIERRI